MATVAAVAGGGRWKHDMFEELVRRQETGADPEVRFIFEQCALFLEVLWGVHVCVWVGGACCRLRLLLLDA
jgi:hypothetical protein